MARIVNWYVGTQEQCDALVASTDTYYGYPDARTKTSTWAIPQQNHFDETQWTIPFNQWMVDNLTYDEANLVDAFPFEFPDEDETFGA